MVEWRKSLKLPSVDAVTERLLRLPEVLTMTGLGRSKLYALVQSGDFAPPVHIGRASAWPLSEVLAFIEAKKSERS